MQELGMLDETIEMIYFKTNKLPKPQDLEGSVLYLGLGTGYYPRNQSEKVTKTTIVELEKASIDFCKDIIKPDWIVLNDDAYTFETTEKFDVIFLDIFYNQVDKEIIDALLNKYKKFLTLNGEIFYIKTIRKQ
jgi:spermidine synthase